MSEIRSRPGMLGRADLIRTWRLGDPELVAHLAGMLGYSELAPPPAQRRGPGRRGRRGEQGPTRGDSPPASIHVDLDLWYADSFRLRPGLGEDLVPSSRGEERIIDDTPAPTNPADPGHQHLCPRAALLTRLRTAAPSLRIGGEIDIARIVHEWSRGRWLRRLPRLRRRTWGRTLQLFVDRSRRLIPYWVDQDYAVHWLSEAIPEAGLATVLMREGDFSPSVMTVGDELTEYEPPAPGSIIVALSDLGALAGPASDLPRLWAERGRRFRDAGVLPLALVPCCRSRIPAELLMVWDVLPWEPPAGEESPPLDDVATRMVVERILTLLSFTLRIEPRLIRYVRRLLPEGRGDPGIEALVWSHEGFDEPSLVSATLSLDRAKTLRERLAGEDRGLRAEVQSRVEQLHREVYPGIWYAELSHLPDDGLVTPRQREEALRFLEELARRLEAAGPNESPDPIEVWLHGVSDRLLPQAYSGRLGPVLHRVWALSHREEPGARPREGMDPRLIIRPGEPIPAEPRLLEVRQKGDRLIVRSARLDDPPDMGSLLGLLRSLNGEIEVAPIDGFWSGGVAPDWATAWGWDDFGAWSEFRVGGVAQRMRWIPPGSFRMGSPEGEEGRFPDEGLPHLVTIGAGFWLFESPCTQALWEAVMGANPSHFRDGGASLPVENVSWGDCLEFVGRLNGRFAGLALSLPSEAQWEYACRAGTTGARYGEPVGEVAWYLENSGGTTHPVVEKQPNAWGLYDMLGNVWEWCADARRDSYDQPTPPASVSAHRMSRGGSWLSYASDVRAASRSFDDPPRQLDVLGFRCAEFRSPGPSGRGRDAERAGSPSEPKGRSPGGDGEPASEVDWLRLSGRDEATITLRELRPLRLRSDMEILTLSTLRRPEWAAAIGRDRFGLWADFEVEGVTQRLRWIPPGRFSMGSPDDEPGRYPGEGPRREVTIETGFWMFATPCTQALWEALTGQNPSEFRSPDLPVEHMSWEDCCRFASRLSERIGLSLRLPTEAQWEYACRAGTTGARYGEPVGEVAWYSENSGGTTHPVGGKRPNAWGLYDMLGNVWEWCADAWRGGYDQPEPPASAFTHRVIRGGSWNDGARGVRAAHRAHVDPPDRDVYLGFRCAEVREGVESAGRSEPVERGTGPRSGPDTARRLSTRRGKKGSRALAEDRRPEGSS